MPNAYIKIKVSQESPRSRFRMFRWHRIALPASWIKSIRIGGTKWRLTMQSKHQILSFMLLSGMWTGQSLLRILWQGSFTRSISCFVPDEMYKSMLNCCYGFAAMIYDLVARQGISIYLFRVSQDVCEHHFSDGHLNYMPTLVHGLRTGATNEVL